jgi:TRAP-type C4-dicarboxylate transport system permease small subunit
LTGFVWQIGAVATVALLFLSYMTYDWAETWIATAEKSPMLLPIATNVGWVAYLLPVMFAAFAVLFSVKTYDTYRNEHF